MSIIEELQRIEIDLQEYLNERIMYEEALYEVEEALKELNDAEEAFYYIGGVIIKKDKEKIINKLNERKKILQTKINSIKKEEQALIERANKLRNQLGG